MAIGSPGATRTMMKTTTATPKNVTARDARRMIAADGRISEDWSGSAKRPLCPSRAWRLEAGRADAPADQTKTSA
jgi:hypothetical protein